MATVCQVLALRTCRRGYGNARTSLGIANRAALAANRAGDAGTARQWGERQGRWLGRCSYWRARLKRYIREIEDDLGRPHRV